MQGAVLVLSGNAATAALLLARNLLIARLLPVEEYGIAATFALVVAMVEMASALGLTQQIVRDRDGDDPHHQAALQGLQLLRGACAAAALWLCAAPVARFLGIPQVAWAFAWLALVPLLNALVHFDMHRLSRRLRFGPMLLGNTVPAAASLALIWPLWMLLGDHRVMLWAVIAQAGLAMLGSHLLAERSWRLTFDAQIIRESLRFGVPILLNGALLFAVFHGDRLIIGHAMGMEALALISLGLTLTLTPTLVLERSAQTHFLPRLAAAQGEGAAFAGLSTAAFQAHLAAGAALVLAVHFAGAPLVGLVLGDRYDAILPLLPWLAVQQALRIAKNGNSPSALAMGQSRVSLAVTVPRVLSLLPAGVVALGGGDLSTLLAIGVVGEGAGLALSLVLTARWLALPLRPLVLPLCCLAVLVVAAVGVEGPAGIVLALLSAAAMLATMPELTRHLRGRAA